MSRGRVLRLVAAGAVVLAGVWSLRLLVTRPGGLEFGVTLSDALPELLTFAAIFSPVLVAGPLAVVCAGALLAGRGAEALDAEQRRSWRSLLIWWLVGLLLPLLLATLGGWLLLRTAGLPILVLLGVGALILVGVRWRAGELDKRVVLAMVLVLVVPAVSWLFSWRGHGYLPGWTFVAVAVMLAAATAGGRTGRWLLLLGLLLAGLGLPRAWRSHLVESLISLIPVGVAAVMVWKHAVRLQRAEISSATRLGLRVAPFALAVTWLGIAALGGDNCILVSYLVGLRDPLVDMASCSGLFPALVWDLARAYRVLLFLGTLPAVAVVLYWQPRAHPRRRWSMALAGLALVPALENTLLVDIPRHFGGMATEAVARASAETKETMVAAGTGLYGYKGLSRSFEYGQLWDTRWEQDRMILDTTLDRFVMLALEPGTRAPASSPRQWFPETLLFEPLVVTDAQGLAAIEVPVPDQLTRWRLLALAHSRSGRQAGAEASFVSTLPLSVDLGSPPDLRVGDRVALPVWVSNNTDEPWSGALHVRVNGADSAGVHDTLGLAPRSSALRWAVVQATEPGRVTVRGVAGGDAVEQVFEVIPSGRPLSSHHGGSLGGPRQIEFEVPQGSLPGGSLSLSVRPGPAGTLLAEAARTPRQRVESQAWSLAVHGRGAALAARLGAEVDAEEEAEAWLRALLELDRFLRITPTEAVMILQATTGSEEALALTQADKALRELTSLQGPDGSFPSDDATLERSLVLSADVARATSERAPIVARKAAGHLERHAPRVSDPCTAAALAASGVVVEPLLGELRTLVRDGVAVLDEGGAVLEPGPLSRRSDGLVPGVVECTARAALALADDPASESLVADLGSALLARWEPVRGFGDGAASLVVLMALEALYHQPLQQRTTLAVRVGGELVHELNLDPSGGLEPQTVPLPAPVGAGIHSVEIEASPPIAGLAFGLEHRVWVPWKVGAMHQGLDLRVEAPPSGVVGQRSPCRLMVALPEGEAAELQLELPAGIEVDLDSVRASGAELRRVRQDGAVLTFDLQGARQGATVAVGFDLIPTLGGTLGWGAARVTVGETTREVPVGSMRVQAATMGT